MKTTKHHRRQRRAYPEELKKEAVQMLLDGHSASSVAHNLGIGHTSLLYRWNKAGTPWATVPICSWRHNHRAALTKYGSATSRSYR